VSHNVIARLPGTSRAGEYVLYGAHWDANGRNGPDGRGDGFRNGAVDNATGTAEVSRSRARSPRAAPRADGRVRRLDRRGERTAGREYYVANPIYPLAKTAGVINLDPHVVLPAARDIELVGGGRTDLESRLSEAAAALGLHVTPEPNPEAGWYFRSDHFPFAKKGVPAVAFAPDATSSKAARRRAMRGSRSTTPATTTRPPTNSIRPGPSPARRRKRASRTSSAACSQTTAGAGWNAASEYGVIRAASDAERARAASE